MLDSFAHDPTHPGERRLIVGQRLRRRDAADKVKGTALYVGDLAYAGALVAGVLRSPQAHARLTELDTTPARSLPGVRAVLSSRDLTGKTPFR